MEKLHFHPQSLGNNLWWLVLEVLEEHWHLVPKPGELGSSFLILILVRMQSALLKNVRKV